MLITIATFPSLIDAQLARTRLAAVDIPAIIPDEHMLNTDWFYTQALGGIRLQVGAEFVERARHVLSTQDNDEFNETDMEQISSERGEEPIAASPGFDNVPAKLLKFAAFIAVLGFALVVVENYAEGHAFLDLFEVGYKTRVRVAAHTLGCVEQQDFEAVRALVKMDNASSEHEGLRMMIDGYLQSGKCRELQAGDVLYQSSEGAGNGMIHVADTLGVGAVWMSASVVDTIEAQ